MKLLSQAHRSGLLLAVVAGVALSVGATAAEKEEKPFRAIRARDQLLLTVGPGLVAFNETIEMTPLETPDKLPPGRPNLLYVLIPPLWVREGGVERPLFSIQRPYFQSSQGRVRRFALLRPDGETVRSPEQFTPDCRWVLTLEFGHVIPKKFTVVVNFVTTQTLNPEAELLYNPSNDGYPVRSGPTESFFTELRVRAEGAWEPWKVTQDGEVLPRATPYTVQLRREFNHVIGFARE